MRKIFALLLSIAAAGLMLLGLAGAVLAADGAAVDPETARATLEGLFSLAGATVGAVLIAAFIQVIKARVPWIENGHEATVAFVASIVLIVFAVVALQKPLDLVNDFGYLIAWVGLAKLVGGMYDVAKATKTAVVGSKG